MTVNKNIYANNDLVSVVIPVYNANEYFDIAIKSVLEQTYNNIEIIIIDDASIKPAKYLGENKKNTPIIYIRHKENMGCGTSRNDGIKCAKGKYIAFLDCDDVWDRTKIEKQIECLKKYNFSFCYTSYDTIDKYGRHLNNKNRIRTITTYNDLLKRTYISTSSVIINKELLRMVQFSKRKTGQDYELWLKLLKNDEAIGLKEPLTHIRRMRKTLSKNKFQNIVDIWEIQTHNEHISKYKVLINLFCYIKYAIGKRINY